MRVFVRFLLHLLPLAALLTTETSAIATITRPITTSFGTYEPKTVTVTPSVPTYTVPDGLSGVLYADQYTFSDGAKAMLVRNGFVATPVDAQSFTAIYKTTNDSNLPVFVTVDAVLHTFYQTYDYMLRIAEYKQFYGQLDSMLTGMLDSVKTLRQSSAGNDSLKLAVTRAAALLNVARTLLTDTIAFVGDSAIRTMVAAETSLVFQHKGFAPSAVVPELTEDFSQYVPRGHYTLDKKFERYFRTMMYLGRMNLSADSRIETMQACVLTRLWATADVGGVKIADLWAKIYNPTAFFVGVSDDPTFTDYADALDRAAGSAWRSGDINVFSTKLAAIMTELKRLPQPRILSGLSLRPGLRMMGQRFVPDSYAFGQLVYNKVGTAANPRLFPRGLDVLAVLGSPQARQHLIDMYHEDQYVNYTEQLDSLTVGFAAMPGSQWAANLYWNWLYTLAPLLQVHGAGYPFFMTTQAWADKSITSAAGSWVELRHASILYAKQSYTSIGIGPGPNSIGSPQGYVEPNPEVFSRIAAMASYMKNGLQCIGLSGVLPLQNLTSLETLCSGLRDIAVKELQNLPVAISEYGFIAFAYKTLNTIADFSGYQVPPGSFPSKASDTSTTLIADVHTDPSTGTVLEVGTGKPMCLYVVVPVEGRLQVCRGAMFSYYEFQQPMDNRLTDVQWQTMLASSNPAMPQWTCSFTSSMDKSSFQIPEVDRTVLVTTSDSIPGTFTAGDSLIAILQSVGTPLILLESNGTVHHGALTSAGWYRVAIPPSVLSDTNILTVNATASGIPCGGCYPPVTAVDVPISYRKVVVRLGVDATINSRRTPPILTHPRFLAGRLTVPPGTAWRVVDGCGRLIATIGPETNCLVPPARLASRLLLLVPVGRTTSKPMPLIINR